MNTLDVPTIWPNVSMHSSETESTAKIHVPHLTGISIMQWLYEG